MSNAFYAVAAGRRVGVFRTWEECQEQVREFKGAKFKKFSSQAMADEFLAGEGTPQGSSAVASSLLGSSRKRPLLAPATTPAASQTVRELHSLRKTVEDLK